MAVPSLGWELLAGENAPSLNRKNTPTNVFEGAWPLLSREEKKLLEEVLEHFYTLNTEKQTEKGLRELLDEYCEANALLLTHEQNEDLTRVLSQHALAAGPLTPLLQHPQLEEISISGVGPGHAVKVYHTQEGWVNTPLFFTEENSLITLLNRLVLASGKRLSAQTPILNAPLSTGQRLHASIYPVCPTRVEACIRKYIVRATHPKELVRTRVMPARALAYLSLALQSDCNMLVVGNTGSGKTTTLNALLGSLPENERIILVEDTPELQLAHEHVVRLLASAGESARMSTLIRETLRMRPDRVVVGEIRFPEEAHAFMESVLAGQGKGTYATFHGHSAAEALSRMRQFGLVESDLAWMNIIVVQRRWSERDAEGKIRDVRGVSEIVELTHTTDGRNASWIIRTIFGWDAAQRALVEKNQSILVREKFGWCFPSGEFDEAYARETSVFKLEEKKQWEKSEKPPLAWRKKIRSVHA